MIPRDAVRVYRHSNNHLRPLRGEGKKGRHAWLFARSCGRYGCPLPLLTGTLHCFLFILYTSLSFRPLPLSALDASRRKGVERR